MLTSFRTFQFPRFALFRRLVILLLFLAIFSSRTTSRHTIPPLDLRDGPVGYFEGAANVGSCGTKMVLIMDSLLSFRPCLDLGVGTNANSKLLSLWGILYYALHKNISDL